jgi:hypothetical protein
MQAGVPFLPPRSAVRLCQCLALLGGISVAAGLIIEPHRTWAALLLVSNYLVGLALGALVLVALHYVTGAQWSTPLRCVPEAMALVLPVAALGVLAVLVLQPSLYPWTTSSHETPSPLRAFWLERPFFLIRAVVYIALWSAFALLMVRASRRQDHSGGRFAIGPASPDPQASAKAVRLSAGFLVVFGITCWLSSYDWIMSLEPDWSSTIFGVYNFAGLFLSALAAVTLVAVCLARHPSLAGVVTKERLHDLGTLLFGFSSFWMYTWFCQYMLIWYTNHPEETAYLRRRWEGDWPMVGLLDVILSWGIPFVVLLFRSAKRNALVMACVAVVILAGRWLDLSLMILPSQGERLAVPGAMEAGLVLGAAGIFGLTILRALARTPFPAWSNPG